jgi:hypothetical protein
VRKSTTIEWAYLVACVGRGLSVCAQFWACVALSAAPSKTLIDVNRVWCYSAAGTVSLSRNKGSGSEKEEGDTHIEKWWKFFEGD